MGYYTYRELETNCQNHIDHEGGISEASDYSSIFDGDHIKWYSHEKDMRAYSKLFPEVIFTVEGDGEETGDNWREHYVNGKMHRCKAEIVFPEYDEKKLK